VLTSEAADVITACPKDLFVGGTWRAAASGTRFSVVNPANERRLCEVADADPSDGFAALAAAVAAFARWRDLPPRERAEILGRASRLLLARADELALLMTLEMGKPVAEARGEVSYSADFLRWYAEEAVRISGRTTLDEHGAGRIVTLREPVGPCLFITPWNFPLAMGARKIAPALAAGCTCVVKPAEQTPLSMLALGRLLEDAGVPAGVVNVIPTSKGPEVMAPLIGDRRARKLSFTGSTEVGRTLIRRSADQVLRTSMELGGNAPFIVFDDADLEAAVEGALLAKLRNGGEACTSANRFYVHESVAETFAERLAERMAASIVGPGVDEATDVGPLIDAAQRAKVADLVDDAVARGARVLTGGAACDGPGWFYRPTVLVDVPVGARILVEEIFGPVAPVVRFAEEHEGVAAANATPFGLVAYIYTRELDRAWRVASALEVGMVGINRGVVSAAAAPFGGAKHSGFGREGGPEGIEEYLETRYLAFSTP